MDPKFIIAGLSYDWLCWIGQPMLYDGGLCVNRTQEEILYSRKHYKSVPLEI